MKLPLTRTQVLDNLPMFLGAALGLAAVWWWGQPADVLPVVLGVIAGGLVDQDHRLTGRLVNVLFTLLAFALSSLAVQWSLGLSGRVFTLVMTALTFGFTVLGAAGARYRTIAFGALAVATYTSLTHHAGADWWLNSALILAGTLGYSLMALLVHAVFPSRGAQQQLALAFAALARYADLKARFFDPDLSAQHGDVQLQFTMQNGAVVEHFNACRRALYYRLTRGSPRERTGELTRMYFAAQDIHERLSAAHFDYAAFHRRWQHTDIPFRVERMLEAQAQFCRDVAAFLLHGTSLHGPAVRLNRDEARLRQSWTWFAARDSERFSALPRVLQNLEAINLQLVQLGAHFPDRPPLQADMTEIVPTDQESFRPALTALRQNLGVHSAVFRHAVRLAVVVAVSGVTVQVFRLELGYWILLTALFVCQPSYTATRSRANQRVVGTLLGMVVGSVIPLVFPSYAARLAVILLSTTLFFAFRSVRYSFSTAFITIEALTALSLTGFDVYQALPTRLLDTLAGAALAWLAVSLLWPDWKWLSVEKSATQALKEVANYLKIIHVQLGQGRADDAPYRLARRRAYEGAAQLGGVVNEITASASHYGAQVPQGQRLLALTYGLLGYVSALGSARTSKDQAGLPGLPPALLDVTGQLADFMLGLPDLPEHQFRADQQNLAGRLESMRPPEGGALPEIIVWQQLNMILDLLGHFHGALRQSEERATERFMPLV